MQPGARRYEVEAIAEVVADTSGQYPMPLAVDAAHPANVARERALVDELCQRVLRYGCGMPIGNEFRLVCRLAQRWRHHHEGQPQGGQQRLRERADIYHASGRIERLQRLERSSAEAKLAVVVVLDDNR